MRKPSDCWYKSVCESECSEHCIRLMEMSYLFENSGIPRNKQKPIKLYPEDCDLEQFRRLNEIKSDIKNFVRDGKNLYITSRTTGNGKTSWALKLMMKYFDEVWAGNCFRVRGLFVNVPTFLLQCKDFNHRDVEFDKIKDNILDADLVIFDDVCGLNLSAYDYSQLYTCVEGRIFRGKSTIYTGNRVTQDELSKGVGVRLASRILSRDTEVIEFNGHDVR